MKSFNISIDQIKDLNRKRNIALRFPYDPILGTGCTGPRTTCHVIDKGEFSIPCPMTDDPAFNPMMTWTEHVKCRIKYDFEFWCATCVTIKDKLTARKIPFVLNRPQRRVLAVLEGMRLARRPIRMILLKARQWGGSTLVQFYMAWIQITLRRNWNSLICGHLKDASAAIKGMYSRLLAEYPVEYWSENSAPKFVPFEKSRNVNMISGRECLVAIGSAESPEAIRGYDIAMAHLTEVAFWRNSPLHSPENIVRSVCGSIALENDTVIIMESTANGMGNFFHTEWLRAKAGLSDKVAVFVPWHEIEIYRYPVEDAGRLWNELDEYERNLWEEGLTLEMINWYHNKRKEYTSHSQMKAEYPSNDIEAFVSSGNMLFDPSMLDKLRTGCKPPLWIGEITGDAESGCKSLSGLRKVQSSKGCLKVWADPDLISPQGKKQYITVVDIGGLSDKADFSVITVFDSCNFAGIPEVVAQWRGHLHHDLLAWKAAQISSWYLKALLVVESNTLETEFADDGASYILEILERFYHNLYRRPSRSGNGQYRIGFHTNAATKQAVVCELMRAVRDNLYLEHDTEAINELSWYERKPSGGYGAVAGKHDDILMTRAIGLYVIARLADYAMRHGVESVHELKIPPYKAI